jgi:hypothetical protein
VTEARIIQIPIADRYDRPNDLLHQRIQVGRELGFRNARNTALYRVLLLARDATFEFE